MKISVEHLLQAESTLSFNGVLTADFVGRFKKPLFPDGLAVTGSVENRAGVVTLDYRARATIAFDCERCLAKVERPFCESFSHTVVKSLADESLEDAFLVVPDGVINLIDVVGTDVQLLLPQVLLCREDCKGLCPVCGADRNNGVCDCRQEPADVRLKILKELL